MSIKIAIKTVPDANIVPSLLNAKQCVGAEWDANSASKCPCAKSHNSSLLSAPAEARNLPSVEKLRACMAA